MATRGMDAVFQHLRRAALLQAGTSITDGQLLESFVVNHDATALEALVRRHGRMVHGVCLRVLRNRHDAEDAFQATFLVLAHKAARVMPREMVGNWLYGVAHTTAVRAKAKAAKRLVRERQVVSMRDIQDAGAGQWDDMQVVLDEELMKLPDKYRVPIVLCDLEGRPRREVARQLKIPEGTLSSRLTTARRTLAKRLSRRGLAVTSATMATLLAQNASSAYVPPALVAATVKAAGMLTAGHAVATGLVSVSVIALKEGVLKGMLISKLKAAVMILALGAVGLGSSLVVQRTGWAVQPNNQGKESATSARGASQIAPAQPIANSGKTGTDARYKKLSDDINRLFPDSHVELNLRGDKLVVSGHAKDVMDARQILRIVRSNAPKVDEDAKPADSLTGNADFTDSLKAQFDALAGAHVVNQFLLAIEPPDRATRNITLEEAIAIAFKNEANDSRKREADTFDGGPGNPHQQRLEFKRQMHNLRLNVEVAYWNLYEATSVLNTCEDVLRGLRRASKGTLDPSISQQIRGQYEEFRSERTNLMGGVLEAESNLNGMMGMPASDGERLVPVTPPSLARVEFKWDDVLSDALQKRPEMALAGENVRLRQTALTQAETSPGVNPASLRSCRLELAQAIAVLKDQEERVKRTLTQQYKGLNKWYGLIEARRGERRAYAEAIAKKFDQVEVGKKAVDLDLLDVQRRVGLAFTKEYQAIAEYNSSLARLQFARGTIMRDDDPIFIENVASVRTVGHEEPARLQTPRQSPARMNAVRLKTAYFEADCNSLTCAGSPDRLVLEGDVHLMCTKNGLSVRVEGQRAVLNLGNGTYTVESGLDHRSAPTRIGTGLIK